MATNMDEQITNLQRLITFISNKLLIDKEAKETALKRGERFNIFETCRIAGDEVRLHSRLIAALLNPKGTHGLGGVFLNAFLRNVIGDEFNFKVESTNVSTEQYIGPVTDHSGGIIDILVKDDNGSLIIIENKIYAGDQENQLLRYYNYAKENSNDFRLIYLTLDGHEPSKESLGKKDDTVYRIYRTASYRDHILRWLEACVKETYDKPLIRETLKQYITVIKQLTNQDMETESKAQMVDMLYREDSIITLNAIESVWHDVITRIWTEVFKPQLAEAIQQQNPPRYQIDHFGNIFDKWCGIKFLVDGWSNFKIRIEFLSAGCTKLIYGIVYKDGHELSKAVGENADKKLRNNTSYGHSQVYPVYKYFDKYGDWTKPETLKDIYSGAVVTEIMRALEELYNVANKIEGM